MLMILSGGGGYAKNPAAYELFVANVDKHRPVLYIPFASIPENYNESYAKFTLSMANLGVYSTVLCSSPEFFSRYTPDEIGGIYCAGGNTFRLLKLLRESGGLDWIVSFLRRGGTYIGSSAGAIIGGADIMPIIYMDANAVMLSDTRGMDMMDGYSTIAHYGDSASEFRNNEWFAAVDMLATQYKKLIALSEESAIAITDTRKYVVGEPCRVFIEGKPRDIENGCDLP